MKFTRMGEWYELSDCGCYTVCAARVGERFKFQAWLLSPTKGQPGELLDTFDDAQAARDYCKDHRELVSTMRKRA